MTKCYLIAQCDRIEFKDACLKHNRKLASMWLDFKISPILVECKRNAIKDCRKWNRQYPRYSYFPIEISVY